MLGRKLLIVLIAVLAFAATARAKANDLKFVVEPLAGSRFRIGVTFAGEGSGVTKFVLPNEWGGQRDLYKAIKIVRVSPTTAKLADTAEPYLKTISHKPGELVSVTYELAQDFQGPLKNSVRYRPVTDPSYIHWIGNTVWALPAWDDSTDVNVDAEWRNFPAAWALSNSFGNAERTQKFSTRLGYLRAALFVGGDFRIEATKAAGKPVYVAIRGTWQFKDAELAEAVSKVIENHRNFWNDHSQNYYLVSLVPVDEGPNAMSFGGTGLNDSFALFATPNATVNRIRGLIAHEYAHNWVPAKLGRMPEPEQQLYWFSEGFTEFYTYQLLHRGGLISLDEFIQKNNELVREYYMLPVRTEPNERIVRDFWSNRDVQRLPYLRGFLFATNLNAAIKRASNGKQSLDDVMYALFAASKNEQQPISFESLAMIFKRYLGTDPTSMMTQQIKNGQLIVPDAEALGPTVKQETVYLPVFELGFDFDKFGKERVVAGVDQNSSAYAAGLRNGQERTGGVSVSFGDTSREIELKVKDADGEKSVRFLPVARERARVPQFVKK